MTCKFNRGACNNIVPTRACCSGFRSRGTFPSYGQAGRAADNCIILAGLEIHEREQ
jgi:hypothetical protein